MKIIYFLLCLSIFPLVNIAASSEKSPENKITEYKYVSSKFNNLRIYQIMVEAFIDGDPEVNYNDGYGPSHHCGDLKGALQALPYIKSLGMNAIWLTPIFDSERGTSHFDPYKNSNIKLDATGYFTRNYFKIDPHFGTFDDAKELVKTAHELGIYVFFDGVFGHHKGNIPKSPNGHSPVGSSHKVSYPESLEFYKEVATYWIDELEIDGWRLDQAYQIPVKYLKEIRETVETKCNERKMAGKKWGTLGYLVGEIWRTKNTISMKGYGSSRMPGLFSCFDFPLRYKLVQALAVEEKGFGSQQASVLKDGYLTHYIYADHAIPNLMLTNHDLVRFGDLVQRAGYGSIKNPDYWKRHKCALSFLTAYTGPITIYYGDEIGDEVENFITKIDNPKDKCWEIGLCDDHVSRTCGKISGFSKDEENLKNYTAQLMQLRQEHPALYNGKTYNLMANKNIYVDYKEINDDKMLYILNISNQDEIVKLAQSAVKGKILRNCFDDSKIEILNDIFEIPVNGLTGNFYIIE